MNILYHYNLDPIPGYLLAKEGITKEDLLSAKWVKVITDQQCEDGSWDRFHTLSADSKTRISTENAIRRLLLLGLDIQDEPIRKVFAYMGAYLKEELDYRDRKEGLSDWKELMQLFTAAWMLNIDSRSKMAGRIADKWAELITRSFTGITFDFGEYSKAFLDIFHVKAGKRVWDIESFHIVSIIKGRISPETEKKFVEYILSNEKGIYYVGNGRGALSNVPENFMSRETSRYLFAHLLLADYPYYRNNCGFVVDWLMKNRGEEGLWDLGPKVKDHVFFPYSDSWRNPVNRKIDSTLYVQKYLNAMEVSHE